MVERAGVRLLAPDWPRTSSVIHAKPNDRPADLPLRVKNEVEIVLGQRKLLKRLVPGLMHAFIFWGFLVLFPTIILAAIDVAMDNYSPIAYSTMIRSVLLNFVQRHRSP